MEVILAYLYKNMLPKSIFPGVCLLLGLVYYSCNRAPNFPDYPQIEFVSITPNRVHNNDSVSVVFSFKDGNGDIGRASHDSISSHADILLIDNRVSNPNLPKDTLPFWVPDITPFGKVKAVSGTMRVEVNGVFQRPGHNPDTLTYTIVLKDRAGHRSNGVATSKVVILP
jgi:hypothetical protein